jgi:ribonuclease-3
MGEPKDIASQDIASQDIASQDIASQDIASQDIASQDIASQDIASQDIASQDIADDDIVASMFARVGVALPAEHIQEALTHSSLGNERPAPVADNQRLEFLGDAVLSLCASEMLMAQFGDVDEGELTVMRASLVNTVALAAAARELDLGPLLHLGRGAEAAGARERNSVLADAVEAILGAVFLDCGLDASRRMTTVIVGPRFDVLVADGGIERDPKSRLQEYVQSRGADIPSYEVVLEEGPPHAKEFTVGVSVALDAHGEHKLEAHGQGRSKKSAERAAARLALDLIAADQDGVSAS